MSRFLRKEVDDGDLLFAVTLRSGKPDQALVIPDADNNYLAGSSRTTGASGPTSRSTSACATRSTPTSRTSAAYDEINPIVQPFLSGRARGADLQQLRARASASTGRQATRRTSVHGGYGIYYDRITLEIQSLERGLDGRALPIEVRAGNVFFLDPTHRPVPAVRAVDSQPVHRLHPARRRRVGHQHHRQRDCRTRRCSSSTSASSTSWPDGVVLRVDGVHNLGTHFIIGRTIGEVFNPVVGGPDRVVNLESSVNTHYDALLVSAEQRGTRFGFRAVVHASPRRSTTPTTTRSRSPTARSIRTTCAASTARRRTISGIASRSPAWARAPAGILVAPIWTHRVGRADGHPACPTASRASRRSSATPAAALFKTAAELNARSRRLNAAAASTAIRCRSCATTRTFNDSFNSLDLRVSRPFTLRAASRVEPIARGVQRVQRHEHPRRRREELLGLLERAGARQRRPRAIPGTCASSGFGQPVTTAGGVFGSGGPRAFQLAGRGRSDGRSRARPRWHVS